LGVNYKVAGEFGVKVAGATLGLVVDIRGGRRSEVTPLSSSGRYRCGWPASTGLEIGGSDPRSNSTGSGQVVEPARFRLRTASLDPDVEFPDVDDVTQFGGNLTLGVGTFATKSGLVRD
jgi:uncharacterized protein YodC (DUF2158 family)